MMKLRLPARFRLRRRHALILAGVAAFYLFYLLFTWLALPGIVQTQAEKFIAEKSGHHLRMERPEFNPFLLSLRLKNLQLSEPDGKPLLAFKELLVDFSASSLFRRAWVFDEIRIDGLDTRLAVLPGNRLNWTALIEALRDKDEKPSPLPRLDIDRFVMSQGQIEVSDQRGQAARTTRLAPIDIELSDLSTLPNDKGIYELNARTAFGAKIAWQGEFALNPLAVNGKFSIEDVALEKLAAYASLPPTLAAPKGMAALAAQFHVVQAGRDIDVQLDQIKASLRGLQIQAAHESAPLLTVDALDLDGGQFDLRQHRVGFAALSVSGGKLAVRRLADGSIDLLKLIPPPTAVTATVEPRAAKAQAAGKHQADTVKSTDAGWHYAIKQVSLKGFNASMYDETLKPTAELALQDIEIELEDFSEDRQRPWPLKVSFKLREGGEGSAQGQIVAGLPSAKLQLRLNAISLQPVQSFLGKLTTLKLADGRVSSEGELNYDAKGIRYSGGFAVNKLKLVEADGKKTFLAWNALSTRTLDFALDRLTIRELLLDGLDAHLLIDKDKSTNLGRILRQPTPAASSASVPAAPPKSSPTAAAKGKAFAVKIGRLRIGKSKLEFADQSLALPFGTNIHGLNGTVVGISSQPGNPARIQIEGQVDDYGLMRSSGKIDPFQPTEALDLKLSFQNVEMTRLTPYTATFAGRRIDSGKLSLDLDYTIKQRQLSGENRVVVDSLKLGERVESPQAMNLPLDLAIAILEDSDGRIDLGLPVSGSLDDPQFSYGRIVWKAIVNVLTKVVTAPFRALGAIFGGNEKLDGLSFEAGKAELSPPEREKLLRFAEALNKRPNLAVGVQGTWSDADVAAMQDLQLRKAIAAKLGLSTEGDPGAFSPEQPKVQSVLEDLVASRLGNGELAALREGYAQANPGKLDVGTGGKMMSMLTGVLGRKRSLSESEIAQMKGASFHAVLYRHLRAAETIPQEKLLALAKSRGDRVMEALKAAKAPMARISLAAPEKIEAVGSDVPLKLSMQSLKK